MANMRRTFADAFMDMLTKKPLSAITVTDLVSQCGVSRQAFYYYFNDIYDLLEWYLIEESDKELKEYSDIDSWQTGYVRMMQWAQKHKSLVMNTYAEDRASKID